MALTEVSKNRMLKTMAHAETYTCSEVGGANKPSSIHNRSCWTIWRAVYLAFSARVRYEFTASCRSCHTLFWSETKSGSQLRSLSRSGYNAFKSSASKSLTVLCVSDWGSSSGSCDSAIIFLDKLNCRAFGETVLMIPDNKTLSAFKQASWF